MSIALGDDVRHDLVLYADWDDIAAGKHAREAVLDGAADAGFEDDGNGIMAWPSVHALGAMG